MNLYNKTKRMLTRLSRNPSNPDPKLRPLLDYSQFSNEKLKTYSEIEPIQLKAFEDQINQLTIIGFAHLLPKEIEQLMIESVFTNRKIDAIKTELVKRKEEHLP